METMPEIHGLIHLAEYFNFTDALEVVQDQEHTYDTQNSNSKTPDSNIDAGQWFISAFKWYF